MLTKFRDWRVVRNLDRRVRKHGWTGVYVGRYGQPPSWMYTIGFDETLDHPEIIVFDVPLAGANGLCWEVFEQLQSGDLRIDDGGVWSDGSEVAPVWRKVHPSQIESADGWLTMAARRRYRRTSQWRGLEAFQLVLPDPEGSFPWDDAYDEHLRPRQPALYVAGAVPDGPDMQPKERQARRLIAERGWTVAAVEGPALFWAYSIGLTETFGVPEVLAFGPDSEAATDKLIEVQRHLRKGRLRLEDGLRWDGLGYEVCWRRVHESQYMGSNWFHLAQVIGQDRTSERAPTEAFQMFIPDGYNLYPWDDGCDPVLRQGQPKLFLPLDPRARPQPLAVKARL